MDYRLWFQPLLREAEPWGPKSKGECWKMVIGSTGEVNVQGEIVQKLDALASETFVNTLSACGCVAAIGSEEIAKTVIVGDDPEHRYLVQMDPLDGSSNIDVAVSIGSIFGVLETECQRTGWGLLDAEKRE